MTCVMLSGSRQISRLNNEVLERLARIVERQLQTIVGDANGADRALQSYLARLQYKNVEVFCSGSMPRNNIGQWACRHIESKARPGTFEFYSAKDKEMARQATVGMTLWDGKSVGSMLNVWRLFESQKPSVVYLQGECRFVEIRTLEDWNNLLALGSRAAVEKIELHTKKSVLRRTSNELQFFNQDLAFARLDA